MQELRQRIRDSYEARWKAEKHFDEDQILNEMPGSLRIEVGGFPAVKQQLHRSTVAAKYACHNLVSLKQVLPQEPLPSTCQALSTVRQPVPQVSLLYRHL